MRQNKTKDMLNYWLALFSKQGDMKENADLRHWPDRNQIQPGSCRTLLSHMFILEKSRLSTHYRLAGTGLCNIFGKELKGQNFETDFVQDDKESMKEWVSRIGLDDYLLLITTSGETTLQKEVHMETLLLPLSNNGTIGNRVLGITIPCDTPQWLGAEPIILQTVRSVRILRPWEEQKTTRLQENPATPVKTSMLFSPPIAPSLNMSRRIESKGQQLIAKLIPRLDPRRPYPQEIAETLDASRKVAHLTVIEGGKTVKLEKQP